MYRSDLEAVAMAEVFDVFDQPGAGFVFMPPGVKFPPREKGWEKKPHTFAEAKAHKGNVGVLAGNGFIGLDKDSPAAFEGLELTTTTLWETRPGRFGLWFRCTEGIAEALATIGKKRDLAQLKLYKNGLPIGEIKLERTYQVIPPSHKFIDRETGDDVLPGKGDRVDYKMLDSSPPAGISLAWLLAELQRLGITFSSKLESKSAKVGRKAAKARQRPGEGDEARTRIYAEAALQSEVETLAGTTQGDRNNQLFKSAANMGEFIAAGALSEDEVISELALAADDTGMDPEEIRKTLRSGLEMGKQHPREIPEAEEPTSNGQTVIDAIKALASVCDGAHSEDGRGFSKFDREHYENLIEKAIADGVLSAKEENTAHRFLKRYTKQLKGLGIKYDDIGHISRGAGGADDNGLAKINERIPEWIAEYHFKTVSDTERLYRYDHGVYLDDGEIVLKALIEKEFGDLTDNRMVSDGIGKVKRRTFTDRDSFNNKNVINVKNGLLDLETLQLQPHAPDYLSTAQIDVVYDAEAKAPRIQQFLKEVAHSEDIALIEEVIGWLLWPDYNIHKALMLIGAGRNGKGTLLRLITAFLGKKSISNVTLQDLVGDRFAKADLYGKLANIGGDLPSKDLSDTAAFRNLTGGDDNRAQEKYRAAFSYRNKAKMIFSANVLPRSPDDTYAFYSRWILLELPNKFDPQKGTGDPDLDAKLQTPEELSGLLNIALEGLKRLRANGWKFSYDKSVEDVEVMYKRNSNPVYAFLMDECESGDVTDYIEKTLFYNRFKDYALKHDIRPMSSTKFGVLLKDQTDIPIADFRPWTQNGAGPRCWMGVRFVGDD